MASKSQNTLSSPMFEKARNVSFALRRKLNACFLSHLFEIRAHTRPDFPVLTFENPSGPDTVQTFQDLHENSHRFAQALVAVQLASDKMVEIVVVGRRESEETVRMLEYIRSVYRPGTVVLFKGWEDRERLAAIAPFTKALEMVDGKATVYLCRNFTCEMPITSLKELQAAFH